MKKQFRTLLSFVSLLFLFLLLSTSAEAAKNVLVIHSYQNVHVWTSGLKQGIDDTLFSKSEVITYHEYLDAKRYPGLKHSDSFLEYLLNKYKETNIDVIMVSDDAALELIRKNRNRFFPDTPFVFLGINRVQQSLIDDPLMTGVFENRDLASTVFDIKSFTQSDHLIIVTDKTRPGQANLSKIMSVQHNVKAPRKLYVIDRLTNDSVKEKFKQYESSIPVLVIGQLYNPLKNNALMSWVDGSSCITDSISNPVFTLGLKTLDHGAIGTDYLGGEIHGEQASELVKQILNGTPISQVNPVIKADSQWYVNWKLMKKYNFSPNNLPEDCIFLHADESYYQKHKRLIWIVVTLLSAFIFIILLLVEVNRRGRHTRNLLTENEIRYKDYAESGASIFWETDQSHCITEISGNTEDIFGKTAADIKGHTLREVLQHLKDVDFPWGSFDEMLKAQQQLSHLIFKIKFKDNKLKVLMLNGRPLFEHKSKFTGYRGILNDITKEHSLSEKLAYQGSFDSLTGLINRTNFNTCLKKAIADTVNEQSYVCFLDLDRFKLVNDVAGHLVGDNLLAQLATVLSDCLEPNDVLGRIGGDEFGLLLIDKTQFQAQAICEKIITNVCEFRYPWNEHNFGVGISIGMVLMSPGLTDIELLSKADLSCYKAKELGKGRVYLADLDNNDLYNDQLQMGYIANVAEAVEKNQFHLMKQPVASTRGNGEYNYYEVLTHFKDQDSNDISPTVFIPAAEKHGVISLIDSWVIETAFDQYNQLFPDNTRIFINISGLSLGSEEFLKQLKRSLRTLKVAPQSICFEITETAVISNMSVVLEFIHEMKSQGIKFALDDFGSGVSSFGYLKQLPIDYLNIGGNLIKNIASEPTDLAIVESINSIAHMMGMQTIAKCVDSEDIFLILTDLGVDYVQGNAIGDLVECQFVGPSPNPRNKRLFTYEGH